LRIPGEVDWRVPSLAVPTANPTTAIDDLVDVESVRLFVERGRAVRTDFGVTKPNAVAVAQICRRLDGLPLAIELAATQVKVFSIEQIAAGLDQRFRSLIVGSRTALPRHQTLAAMVAWSYDLLTTSAQTLFNRLSVFAGGFTLDGAEQVSGDGTRGPDTIVGLLCELVQKSMVVAEGGTAGIERYHLLETLRQYGRERLILGGEDESVQNRHAVYYLQFAEEVRPHLFRPEQLVYLARLDREWDNIRATMRWFLDRGLAEEGLRLLAALDMFLQYRGRDETEGFSWCTQLLGLPVSARPSPARANGLLWAGIANIDFGNVALGRPLVVESLTMARQLGDNRLMAWVMLMTGRYGGPHDEQWCGLTERGLLEGALTLYRAAEDRWGIAYALNSLGDLAYHEGDNAKARQLLSESLAAARSIGDRHTTAQAFLMLGEITSAQSDEEAGTYLYESLRLSREIGDMQAYACIEVILGRLEYLHQRYASAGAHYRAGLRSLKEIGYMYYLVRSIEGLAKVAAGQERLVRALRLAAASAHLREVNGQIWRPIMQAELERALAPIRQALAPSVATAAWAEGQAMTLDQAVAYALEDNEEVVTGFDR
jgi:predicted ATPase